MAARKTRSKKTKAEPTPVEVAETPIVELAPEVELEEEVTEVIPTPEPEFDIVFTPDDELDIVFTPEVDVPPEPEPKPRILLREDDPDMHGLTQTRFGSGKHKWRRRTRRLKGD